MADSFIGTEKGINVREAFNLLMDYIAYYDHGNKPFASVGRCVKSYSSYSESNEKEATELAKSLVEKKLEKIYAADLGVAEYIDLGITDYLVTKKRRRVETVPIHRYVFFGLKNN